MLVTSLCHYKAHTNSNNNNPGINVNGVAVGVIERLNTHEAIIAKLILLELYTFGCNFLFKIEDSGVVY